MIFRKLIFKIQIITTTQSRSRLIIQLERLVLYSHKTGWRDSTQYAGHRTGASTQYSIAQYTTAGTEQRRARERARQQAEQQREENNSTAERHSNTESQRNNIRQQTQAAHVQGVYWSKEQSRTGNYRHRATGERRASGDKHTERDRTQKEKSVEYMGKSFILQGNKRLNP